MATVIQPASESPFVTVGQLLESTPAIPVARIRLSPTPGTATEDDVLAVHAKEKMLCELVDGILVEKAMGYEESIIAGYLLSAIHRYLDEHDLGVAAGADGMLRIAPGLVRIPDASYISWSRLPGRAFPPQAIWQMAPDLAVEVLSESNTKAEIARKIGEYFAAGTQLVWIVDPRTKTAQVYRSPELCREIAAGGTLDGEQVLPGLTLPLSRIFRHQGS